MKIILLGPPGAGKGTQAKRLERALGLPHVASGDIFRDIRRENSPLAQQVQEYMDRGDYVPDQLTIELVLRRLDQPDALTGFLLDGFPRTLAQAEALDEALNSRETSIDRAVYITGPPDLLMKRLAGRVVCPQCHAIYNLQTRPPKVDGVCDLCGHGLDRRTDEDPDTIQVRLEVFIQQTLPLVGYYRAKGLLKEIDGARPVEEVDTEVDRALGLTGAAR